MRNFAFFCLLGMLLSGCYEQKTYTDTIIATVNGKPIFLQTVLTLQEAQSPPLSEMSSSQKHILESLHEQYEEALSSLIFYELIVQELEKKNIFVSDAMLAAEEKNLRADYPEGEFEKYLAENVIDITAWRALLRYGLAFTLFKEHIIRHEFVPSLEDVQEYYTKHKVHFNIPEKLSMYVVSSDDKAMLQPIDTVEALSSKLTEKLSEEIFIPLTNVLTAQGLLQNPSDVSKKVLTKNTDTVASDQQATAKTSTDNTAAQKTASKDTKTSSNLQESQEEPSITQYKVTLEATTLPANWQKALKSLQEGSCTAVLTQEKSFIRLCLEKKFPERQLSVSEAYVYIEDFLTEEHWEKKLDTWIEEKIANAKVMVNTKLLEYYKNK